MSNPSEANFIPPRLELFSDAFFAIIITIMVLELHPPEGITLKDLTPVLPIFFSYCISFLNLTLNWFNHHHLLQTMGRPTAKVMWANAHLLFWASLIPFATAWLGHSIGEVIPTALYASVFLFYAFAYVILQNTILKEEGRRSTLAKALGNDWKGRLTLIAHVAAVGVAFFAPWASITIILGIVLFWILPDPRIERQLLKEVLNQ
jgi:uncharacterized membrane protein